MTPPDAPTPPEAPELATLPPGLLILIDKADDWLEASKLANRDFATAQHGIAADLKRKAFVEFIHASVRENPKTLQTGLSLLRSLARRLQEAEAERDDARARLALISGWLANEESLDPIARELVLRGAAEVFDWQMPDAQAVALRFIERCVGMKMPGGRPDA